MSKLDGANQYFTPYKKKRPLNTKADRTLTLRRNYHLAVANDGGRFLLCIDGVEIDPKYFKDFTIEGWAYAPETTKDGTDLLTEDVKPPQGELEAQ